MRNQLPRGHLGLFHLHRHVFHGLPHTPRHSILLQTRQNCMFRHASAPKQHDLHRINARIHDKLAAFRSRCRSLCFRFPHRTHCIEFHRNRYMSPPSMICTGQSERSLYTCSARVGEICPNLFAEGAAIGSPDYFALCMITLQRGAIRGLVAGWDSGIRPCLFQQKLDYKKSGRVRSLGRTSFAFITIVKGPGQKEVAREWKILRS